MSHKLLGNGQNFLTARTIFLEKHSVCNDLQSFPGKVTPLSGHVSPHNIISGCVFSANSILDFQRKCFEAGTLEYFLKLCSLEIARLDVGGEDGEGEGGGEAGAICHIYLSHNCFYAITATSSALLCHSFQDDS